MAVAWTFLRYLLTRVRVKQYDSYKYKDRIDKVKRGKREMWAK